MEEGSTSFFFRSASFFLLCPFQELGDFLARAELHVGLLPVGALTDEAPLALHLAVRDRGPDALDFRAEQLLDGALDVDLRRARRDLEHERAAVFTQQRRLLGDERAADNVCLFHVSSQLPVTSCQFRFLPETGSWLLATTRATPAVFPVLRESQ